MTAPYFGFQFRREALEPAPPSNAIMSIVGMCGPASPATGVDAGEFNTTFPIDTPVMFNSTDAKARMIDPYGNIGAALTAINNQLGRMQFSARVIFTRVAASVNGDPDLKKQEEISNIVGNPSAGTGINSFKRAGAICGAYPRLVCIPGYTDWQDSPSEANPIVAALPAVLNSYLGVAVVQCPGTTEQAAMDYRETIQSDRIIAVDPFVRTFENAIEVTRDITASIIGLGVRRDFQYEGRPFRSWANQPVYGIISPSRYIAFGLTDGATEGQTLLTHQVGILVRGETGDDFAIADGGFVFIGLDNCDTESNGIWQQYHKVRGRDFIELTALRTLRAYLGRFNLTTHTIQVVVNTVGNMLNISQSKGDILGYMCRFDPDENNPDDLRTGKIYIDARFEEAPVFRLATILSRPHRPALEATIASLTASTILSEPVT